MKQFIFGIFLIVMPLHLLWAVELEVVHNEEFSERTQSIIIPPVDFTCAIVEANGDVTLNWSPGFPGGGVFVEYRLFNLQSGALPIATFTNINTDTYTHVGAGGDLASTDYYMVTVSDCNGVMEVSLSDTVSSIFMEINDLGDGRIFIEWNATSEPQLPNEAPTYSIMREFPAGVWQERASISYGTYLTRDTIDVCNAFLNYRVEVTNSEGCTSVSNIQGDMLQDIINPYIPVITNVTVDTSTQNATIFWNENGAADTYGYIILKRVNGFWENIDTVFGRGNTTYIDLTSLEDVQSETYAIAAFDSCIVNNVPPNFQTSAASTSHSTIFAETSVDLCDLSLSLSWTSYNGWVGDESISAYEILLKKGDGIYEVIANLSAASGRFNYEGLQNNETYCFYVRAVSSSGILSYSNQVCKTIIPPSNPQFHYLSMASHTLNGNIEVEFYTDSDADPVAYEVYKKGPKEFDFSIVGSITPEPPVDLYSYFDEEVQDRGIYEYKVGIIDTCNNTSFITPITETIFLRLDVDEDNKQNTLSWTEYEGFAGNIVQYRIFRGENGVYPDIPIADNITGKLSYTDDLSEVFEGEGGFCYRVEVVESPNKYLFSRTAFSNEVCMTLEPIIFVPSAMVINGANDVFKPVLDLFDAETYQMEIFNRWGEVLFVTQKQDQGWPGTAPNGGEVIEGVYVYRITLRDVEGKRYEKAGTFVVLKR